MFAVIFALGGAVVGVMLNYAICSPRRISYGVVAGIGAAIGGILGASSIFDRK